jgi:UDP-N-acetylglucosamine 2-epimerase
MSRVFFEQLALPLPDEDLAVGSGQHGEQTGQMLVKLEGWMQQNAPDAVLVYGDTNSTLAATLAAAKLHIPIAHIEAGLRSFNRLMPEEINRLVADHCSDRLYAPTPKALDNLQSERLGDRSILTGDVMRDAVRFYQDVAARESQILQSLGLEAREYGVLTLHRPAMTRPEVLLETLSVVSRLSSELLPLVFPMHPRTKAVLSSAGVEVSGDLKVIEPVGYLDMIQLLGGARMVLTDSGGVQKEAAFLSTPCITLREETEWVETVDIGLNQLVGHDAERLQEAVRACLDRAGHISQSMSKEMDTQYGRGNAAEIIAADLVGWIGSL